MACDLWIVPLVDTLVHHPENPFAEELARYERALARAGLPGVPVYLHNPPHSGDVEQLAGVDYQALHFLRRARLLQLTGFEVTPVDELGGDYTQLLEMFEDAARQSHLVWHFDHSGAYLPLDFDRPVDDEELAADGGPLGSSQGLLRELYEVAPLIGVDADEPPPPPRPLGPTEFEGPAERDPLNHGDYHQERAAWAALHRAAERSVGTGAMVVFA
ncbi:hypothetical protein BIV57_15685 [Mangrovactinospora gilvigrisea]|uniref:Uncharacterized protein n=1 Tax=Mangrovactinospora gilvigrisea TaxID=1428644 RepID=A0A1J7C4V7_9ACTN|nr:hypothetical protein [Mangrovactinospora gilvigrisea]OIV36592.1 hypothetical protein BIV57_15685 [Mangrovactinospora gilvigrisea]